MHLALEGRPSPGRPPPVGHHNGEALVGEPLGLQPERACGHDVLEPGTAVGGHEDGQFAPTRAVCVMAFGQHNAHAQPAAADPEETDDRVDDRRLRHVAQGLGRRALQLHLGSQPGPRHAAGSHDPDRPVAIGAGDALDRSQLPEPGPTGGPAPGLDGLWLGRGGEHNGASHAGDLSDLEPGRGQPPLPQFEAPGAGVGPGPDQLPAVGPGGHARRPAYPGVVAHLVQDRRGALLEVGDQDRAGLVVPLLHQQQGRAAAAPVHRYQVRVAPVVPAHPCPFATGDHWDVPEADEGVGRTGGGVTVGLGRSAGRRGVRGPPGAHRAVVDAGG